MARQNPYAMDPYLAQGFSNLTKALIGDAETDYQVARTDYTKAQQNRLDQLLPLELKSEQALASQRNAAAMASNAIAKLNAAKTLTEDELRNPRVQTELAKAQAELAMAQERLSGANLNNAKTETENALRTPRVNTENANTAAAKAQAQSRTADALLSESKTETENALRTPRVNTENANTAAAEAQAAERNAAADAKTALAEDRRASAAARGRISLAPGHTIIYTDENGQRQTYTAPKQTELTLAPGEEAVVRLPDGTTETYKGPAKPADPKDGTDRLANVDAQVQAFTGSEDYQTVPQSVVRKLRSKYTASSSGMDAEALAAKVQEQLSQTYDGQNVVTVQDGVFDGPAFGVPAYIMNFIVEAAEKGRMPSAEAIAKEYGFSKKQAEAIINFIKG